MNEENVYIGGTSIQIGQHGFINQPKEIIEYIKYLQNQLQQKENIIKEVREDLESIFMLDDVTITNNAVEIINKLIERLENEKS